MYAQITLVKVIALVYLSNSKLVDFILQKASYKEIKETPLVQFMVYLTALGELLKRIQEITNPFTTIIAVLPVDTLDSANRIKILSSIAVLLQNGAPKVANLDKFIKIMKSMEIIKVLLINISFIYLFRFLAYC